MNMKENKRRPCRDGAESSTTKLEPGGASKGAEGAELPAGFWTQTSKQLFSLSADSRRTERTPLSANDDILRAGAPFSASAEGRREGTDGAAPTQAVGTAVGTVLANSEKGDKGSEAALDDLFADQKRTFHKNTTRSCAFMLVVSKNVPPAGQ